MRIRLLIFLSCLTQTLGVSLPAKLFVESEIVLPTIRGATGIYSIVWRKSKKSGGVEAHYKLDTTSAAPRYLYRSHAKKAWIITSSEDNIEKDKV